jgi:hypothetical protein
MQNAAGDFFGPQCWIDINVIDSTPPDTKITLSPAVPDGSDGWYLTPVTMTLNATSPDDPVSETRYTLDDLTWVKYTGPVVLPRGEHTLRVMSIDSHNNPEEPEEPLAVKYRDPAAPWGPTPVDGATDVAISTKLSWMSGAGATGYDLYVWLDGSTKPSVPIAGNLTTTAYKPKTLLDLGRKYLWQVVARGQSGTIAGPEWNFTTELVVSETSVTNVKKLANGKKVNLSDDQKLLVTGSFGDKFYMENIARTFGIQVSWDKPLNLGTRVGVIGEMGTNADFERYITASQVLTYGAGTNIRPLSMILKSIGGGSYLYDILTGAGQHGVSQYRATKKQDGTWLRQLTDAVGLNNIGLLVKVTGTVQSSEPGTTSVPGAFYVSDGSLLDPSTPDKQGVRVVVPIGTTVPSKGEVVTVTGLSSCYSIDNNVFRLIRARTASDIVIYTTQ